jgi:hypothetical protein
MHYTIFIPGVTQCTQVSSPKHKSICTCLCSIKCFVDQHADTFLYPQVSCILVDKILCGTTFLCILTSVLNAFYTTDIIQWQCSWSSHARFIIQIYSTILECSVPHRNVFPNHHELPIDSNKFSVNWVCVFCLIHARTEAHLAPPCWYTHNFQVSHTATALHISSQPYRYLAISTSTLTLVLHTCNQEMLFWLLQQALFLPHHILVQYWQWSFIFTSCTCTLLSEEPSYTVLIYYFE